MVTDDDPQLIDHKSIFDTKTRMRLIYETMIADADEGGADLDLDEDIEDSKHPLQAVFPLHDKTLLRKSNNEWLRKYDWKWKTWAKCPLEDIRAYFGERVSFYFAFLQYYITWLVLPAIVGLVFFIFQMMSG